MFRESPLKNKYYITPTLLKSVPYIYIYIYIYIYYMAKDFAMVWTDPILEIIARRGIPGLEFQGLWGDNQSMKTRICLYRFTFFFFFFFTGLFQI